MHLGGGDETQGNWATPKGSLAPDAEGSLGRYSFDLKNSEMVKQNEYEAMQSNLTDIASSLGAEPDSARSIVKHVDDFIARNPDIEPPTPEGLREAIQAKYSNADEIIGQAKAAVQKLSEEQREIIFQAIDRLDAPTGAYAISFLARYGRN